MALAGTVSWLRAYPSALRTDRVPESALRLEPVELDLGFYDIQALDERFFASWRIRGITVEIADLPDNATLPERPVEAFMLLHRSGFAAFRWTVAFDGVATSEQVAALHRPIWVSSPQQTWRFTDAQGSTHELANGAREAMNWVFFDLHERSRGRTPSSAQLAAWNATWRESFDRLLALRAAGETASAYAVTFGSHFELRAPDARQRLAQLLGGAPAGEVTGSSLPWAVGENRDAIAVAASEARDAQLGVYSRPHVQVVEFLALQRGALRSLQRESQSVITSGGSVNRDTVRRWYWLLASITDDYVLHDQAAQLSESYKRHVETRPDLRTIRTLEDQVRRNLESFQSQFAVADVKTTVVLTALFGVVAAIALGPVARRIAIELSGSRASPSRFDDLHPVWAIGIDATLVALIALLAATVVRRARRLSPG